MNHVLLLCCATAIVVVAASPDSCAYQGCHPVHKGKLNIHLVAHTHDDVGWLKTVDQYYYGSGRKYTPNGIQYILDSVVSELQKKESRRFAYVETAYLWLWWQEQDEEIHALVRNLVKEGRLQLVHGGWCMSDEATPHYSMLIDQMTFGLKFLKETFGECGIPKIAWQIDSFGHSSEVALQFAEMGYDSVFFSRIEYEEFNNRKHSKSMEFVWRPDTSLGERGELFAGILYNKYMPPEGFCFDIYCSDEPIMDNPKLHGYNVDDRINEFVRSCREWAESYNTNHVMATMGGDFYYMVASTWFTNMDKLVKYTNAKFPDVNVLYSTPACYLKALHETNTTWPVKDNKDIFPYSDAPSSYWTGYYTSRPSFKNMIYRANNVHQAIKQLATSLGQGMEEEEMLMNRVVALTQHHDAISGTEKQHVADDYALYLSQGLDAAEEIFTAAYKKWLGSELPHLQFCRLANISQCEVSDEATRFVVTVYNPQSHVLSYNVRVPVTPGKYRVVGSTGEDIPMELVPIPVEVLKLPGRKANTTLELLFIAEGLPPLGVLSYHVERFEAGTDPLTDPQNLQQQAFINHNKKGLNASEESTVGKIQEASAKPLQETNLEDPDDIIVENGILRLVFNGSTGHLQFIEQDGEKLAFHQNFYCYKGFGSGAYVFEAYGDAVPVSDYANISVFRGKNITEVHQKFTPWVSQVIRLYRMKDQIEMHWLVGPLVESGQEVITRYTTQLLSEGKWYTDSNGRRMIQRGRDQSSIASNYFPVTSAAVLQDNKNCLTVLTDRAQGATSLADGQLEFMLHRRLLHDDGKGLEEALKEQQYGKGLVARGVHIIQISKAYEQSDNKAGGREGVGSTTNSTSPLGTGLPKEIPYKYRDGAVRHRLEALNLVYGPLLTFARTKLSPAEWSKSFQMKFSGMLKNPLPANIHLLTLERWINGSILVRLEHLFETTEHPILSQPVTIKLQDLLADYNVTHAVELTLGGNEEAAKATRLSWRHEGSRSNVVRHPLSNDLSITLEPMDIRTFQLFDDSNKMV